MGALSAIVFNTETIGAAYAPSLNAAFRELYRLSGIKPVVLAPYGGARTPAQQQTINPSTPGSDHVKQRAVDIANHQRIRNVIGSAKFRAVLNAHGWANVQVNGAPFPAEPWHWANQSSNPAGGDVDPLEPEPEERKRAMTTRYAQIGSSLDGKGGDGQIVALAGDVGYPCPGNWDEYVRKTGANDRAIAEFKVHGEPIWLTKAEWPLFKAKYTTGGATFEGDVTVPADPALLAALTENTAVLRELVAATKALNPPG